MNADTALAEPQRQPFAESSTQPAHPGALHGEVWLTLQTRQAHQLIHGREQSSTKPAIIGLVGFANRLRVIWQAARSDDPYADWWLIQIHQAIEAAETFLAERQATLTDQLKQMTAMEASVANSCHPFRVQLQFANPYAYRAARLLVRFDALICTALTACHIGLLDQESRRETQHACARKLRALFMIPQAYRFLKLDRATVHAQTGRTHEARQAMGELPRGILSGEHQPPLAPRKIKFPSSMSGQMKLRPASPSKPERRDDENEDQ